jgi:hypothetical protein
MVDAYCHAFDKLEDISNCGKPLTSLYVTPKAVFLASPPSLETPLSFDGIAIE